MQCVEKQNGLNCPGSKRFAQQCFRLDRPVLYQNFLTDSTDANAVSPSSTRISLTHISTENIGCHICF